MPWFVPAGLVLGCLCSLAALAAYTAAEALLPLQAAVFAPLIAALFWLLGEAVLSRALHWDGLADLFDGIGSFREGDEFWAVMKDSRIGTFGAMALLAVFSGQLIAAAAHAACGQWFLLALAPAWSRGMAALAMCRVPPRSSASLGGKMASGGSAGVFILTLVLEAFLCLAALASGASAACLAVLCAAQAALLCAVMRLARSKGGFSGDFAGAAIELSQVCFLIILF